MNLNELKKGETFKVVDINEKELNSKLLSLGICKGEKCQLDHISNGNVVVKTPETKIALSLNLASKILVETV